MTGNSLRLEVFVYIGNQSLEERNSMDVLGVIAHLGHFAAITIWGINDLIG